MVEPLFYSENLITATVGKTSVLSGPEAKHAVSVRRMQVGEAIQLTDGRG
ncbi:MAG: methyltransferase, partial [Actinomycetota bacterium]